MSGRPEILIAGGAGFIGSHLARHARVLGWNVTSLSLHGGGDSIAVDLQDVEALRQALRGQRFDYVVNSGGYVDHTLMRDGGGRVFDMHLQSVRNLVQVLDHAALKSFVNIGSADEYGNQPSPQAETLREAPISPYALGKTAAAHFLQMLHRTEGFPAITARIFLTYGPGQSSKRFIPQIIQGCLDDAVFPVSAGEQRRDFCYIDDVVAGIFAALQCPAAHGEVINIASGTPRRIREAIELIQQRSGGGTPQFGTLPYRPGENMALVADIAKAKQLLGWRPQVPFEQGIEQTIAWMRGTHG